LSHNFRRILVVDDSAPDRFAIKRSLKKYAGTELEFQQADSAAAALALLETESFDGIIVDFYLRDLPGTDLLRKLRATLGELPCPVVMVTGSLESEKLAVQALEAGAHDYIEKNRLREPALWKALLYASSRFELAQEFAATNSRLTALNSELERKNQLKTQFLANATHELRTPVTAIIGLVGLIRDHDGLPPEITDHLASITACCDSLLNSVNDVLDLTKIETGEFVLETSAFCPYEVVHRVAQTFTHLASDRNIIIQTLVPDVVPYVLGDGKRVTQVLMNFVGNALKYTDGGSIALKLSIVPDPGDKRRLRFEVEDTGVGIPDHEVPHVFERHFQASNSSGKVSSSGLGLAIVKELADQMGGRVGCRSKVGVGTVFWFEMTFEPASEPHEESTEGDDERADLSANVLIAEDNVILARVIEHQFRKLGCRVTLVDCGEAAVKAASEEPYCMIVLDARMPGIGGLEASRRIRARLGKEVPIVLLTADSLLPSSDLEQYGITAAYVKPLSEKDIEIKILSLMA